MYSQKPARKLRTYHHIGEAAFGKIGLYVTLAFQNATLIAVGTLFLILAGSNAKSFFEQFHWWKPQSVSIYILATAIVVLPFNVGLKTMKEISWVAIFGMLATSFTVVVVVIFSILDRDDKATHSWVNAPQYPFAFATFVFAFGGHNVFPAIQDSMRNTRDFNKMFNSAFLVIMGLYLPPCIVGYWAFGDKVESPILSNLRVGVVPDMAIVAITLHILVTIPLIDNPVYLWAEDLVKIPSRFELIFRIGVRTIILAAQTGIAIGVPYFGDVMGFIGASCVSTTVFFLPCAIYLKLYWKKISVLEKVWIFLILLFAALGSIIGIYSASIGIYQDIRNTTLNVPRKVFYEIVGATTGVSIIIITLSLYLIYRSSKTSSVSTPRI